MKGWTVPLRVARRDALRSRGRSALIVAMIAIPVLGLGAVDVLFRSITVDTHERVDLEMGTRADAWVRFSPAGDNLPIEQSVDATQFGSAPDAKPLAVVKPLSGLLPPGSHVAVVDSAPATVAEPASREGKDANTDVVLADVRDPLVAARRRHRTHHEPGTRREGVTEWDPPTTNSTTRSAAISRSS